jgi:hypothetical protein
MHKKIIFSLLLMTGFSTYGMDHSSRRPADFTISYDPTRVYFAAILKNEEKQKTDPQQQPTPEKKDLGQQKVVLPRLFIVQASKL